MTVAVLVVAVAGMTPLSQVAGDVNVPSLGWIEPGHTFHYELTNGTHSQSFNATITEEWSDRVLFEFWSNVSGQPDTFEWIWVTTDGSRENLNYTNSSVTNWTYIWVNEDNVVSDSAHIGPEEYGELATTTDTVVFGDDAVEFTFDLENGWLEKVTETTSETTWKLRHTSTMDPDDIDDREKLINDHCDDTEWDNEELVAKWEDDTFDPKEYQSVGQLCWNNEPCGSEDVVLHTASRIRWYSVLNTDHGVAQKHVIDRTTDWNNDTETGILPDPEHVIQVDDAPASPVMWSEWSFSYLPDADTHDIGVETSTWGSGTRDETVTVQATETVCE